MHPSEVVLYSKQTLESYLSQDYKKNVAFHKFREFLKHIVPLSYHHHHPTRLNYIWIVNLVDKV